MHNPDDFSHNQSAPAHHSRTTGHKTAWDRTTILTTTRYKTQLDLTEHTAIKTINPSLSRFLAKKNVLDRGYTVASHRSNFEQMIQNTHWWPCLTVAEKFLGGLWP